MTLSELTNLIGALAALVAAVGTVLNGYRAIATKAIVTAAAADSLEAVVISREGVAVSRSNTDKIEQVHAAVENGYSAGLEKVAEGVARKLEDVADNVAGKLESVAIVTAAKLATKLPPGVSEDRRTGDADRRKPT
jgi:hypothetical protein